MRIFSFCLMGEDRVSYALKFAKNDLNLDVDPYSAGSMKM